MFYRLESLHDISIVIFLFHFHREKELAKKYYDKLFKEYCIADLSRYKENKVSGWMGKYKLRRAVFHSQAKKNV